MSGRSPHTPTQVYIGMSPTATPTRSMYDTPERGRGGARDDGGSPSGGGGGGIGVGSGSGVYGPSSGSLSGSTPHAVTRYPPPQPIASAGAAGAAAGGGAARYDVVDAVLPHTPDSVGSEHSVNAVLIAVGGGGGGGGGGASGAGSGALTGSHVGSGSGVGSGVGSGAAGSGARVMAPSSHAALRAGHHSPATLQLHSPQHVDRSTAAQYDSPVRPVRQLSAGAGGAAAAGARGIAAPVMGSESVPPSAATGGLVPAGSQSSGQLHLRMNSPSQLSYLQPPQPSLPHIPRDQTSPVLVPALPAQPHRSSAQRGNRAAGPSRPLMALSLPGQQQPHASSASATVTAAGRSLRDQQYADGAREVSAAFLAGRVVWTDQCGEDWQLYMRNRHLCVGACCAHRLHPYTRGSRACMLLSTALFALLISALLTIRFGCNQCPATDDCYSCLTDQGFSASDAAAYGPGSTGAYTSALYRNSAVASLRASLHPCHWCGPAAAVPGVNGPVPAQCFDANGGASLNAFGIDQFVLAPVQCPANITYTTSTACPLASADAAAGGGSSSFLRAYAALHDATPNSALYVACSTPTILYAVSATLSAFCVLAYQWLLETMARCSCAYCYEGVRRGREKRRDPRGGDMDASLLAHEHAGSPPPIGSGHRTPTAAGTGGGGVPRNASGRGSAGGGAEATVYSIDADGHRIPSRRLRCCGLCSRHFWWDTCCCVGIAHGLTWFSAAMGLCCLAVASLALIAARADWPVALAATALCVVCSWCMSALWGSVWFLFRRELQRDVYRDQPPPHALFETDADAAAASAASAADLDGVMLSPELADGATAVFGDATVSRAAADSTESTRTKSRAHSQRSHQQQPYHQQHHGLPVPHAVTSPQRPGVAGASAASASVVGGGTSAASGLLTTPQNGSDVRPGSHDAPQFIGPDDGDDDGPHYAAVPHDFDVGGTPRAH